MSVLVSVSSCCHWWVESREVVAAFEFRAVVAIGSAIVEGIIVGEFDQGTIVEGNVVGIIGGFV